VIRIKYTNEQNLPQEIYDAVATDDYTREGADYSVSDLLNPPQKLHLIRTLDVEIEVDVSEKLYALMGEAIHRVLDKVPSENYKECRMHMDFDGVSVTGKPDLITVGGDIYDYKFMSIWEYIYGLKEEKTQQLQIYSLMAERTGLIKETGNLYVVPMFRDWSKSKARYEKNYPRTQLMVIPVPLQSAQDREELLRERIELCQGEPRECTAKERWAKDDVYAVMKSGRKTSIKNYDNYESAYQHCDRLVGPHYVEKRPGNSTHCEDYCIVADHCPQWEELRREKR
jgi:hypothetical protein